MDILTNENNNEVKDGNIPIDSVKVGAATDLDRNDGIQAVFKNTNIGDLLNLANKANQFNKTIVPLVEVALIELLGQSNLYSREEAMLTPNGKQVDFSLKYLIPGYVGTDVDLEDIQYDASYIYNKITVIKTMKITNCQIDTTEGSVVIKGSF